MKCDFFFFWDIYIIFLTLWQPSASCWTSWMVSLVWITDAPVSSHVRFFPVFGSKWSRLHRKEEVSTWGSHASVYTYTCGLSDNVRPILVNHSVVDVVTWVKNIFFFKLLKQLWGVPSASSKPNLKLKPGNIRRICDWIKTSQPSQQNKILALCAFVNHDCVKVNFYSATISGRTLFPQPTSRTSNWTELKRKRQLDKDATNDWSQWVKQGNWSAMLDSSSTSS